MAPVTGAQPECCRNWCICEINALIFRQRFVTFVLNDDLMTLLAKKLFVAKAD